MSTYKIGVLQQALDESVPGAELEAANKQYNELTAKYRDIIQRENSLVARSAIVDNLEVVFFLLNKIVRLLFCVFLSQEEYLLIRLELIMASLIYISPVLLSGTIGTVLMLNASLVFFFSIFFF